MVFSSLIFVFAFLPVALLGDWMCHKNIWLRNLFLFLISAVFYAWSEPQMVLLLLNTILINWLCAILMSRWEMRWIGIAAIVIDIAILFFCKYFNWFIGGLSSTFHLLVCVKKITLPLGISFYTFQAISYVVDIMRGKAKAQKNPLNVGLYIMFFPQLIAGPIVRYSDIEKRLQDRRVSLDNFSDGVMRFLAGFCKKILLADNMAIIVEQAFSLLRDRQLGILFAWLGALAYAFQIFFDFCAYSDMAIGLGAMFGFRIPENFNMPYLAYSFRDFWRRWHMSLSIWFRDYVYIPLGGNRINCRRTYFNIAMVWLLTGLWHGANLTFLMWGGIYGVLIIAEKCLNIENALKRHRGLGFIYRVFVLVIIVLLWIIFRADNIEIAMQYIKTMFDINKVQISMHYFIMYILEFKWELLTCMVMSFLVLPQKILQNSIYKSIRAIALLGLFFISVSYLVKDGFSPFLYFNF